MAGQATPNRFVEAQAALARWMTNRQSDPLLLVDEQLNTLYVNDGALAFASQKRTPITLHGQHLETTDPNARARLLESIRELSRDHSATRHVSAHGIDFELAYVPWRVRSGAYVIWLHRATAKVTFNEAQLGKLTAKEAAAAKAIATTEINGSHLTGPQIARQLGISADALKRRVKRIYQKLGVHTRKELVDELT